MRKLKLLSFNLALLVFLLLIVEIFLRIANPNYKYYYRSHPSQPDLQEILDKTNTNWLQADDELGWICQQKEQLDFPSPPKKNVVYQINEQGFRMPFNLKDTFPNDKKKILLLGDSFMFGIYLQESETVTSRLQKAKGEDYVFYTIAVPAWGLDQMYLAYKKYIDRIQPDQVVLAFIDDDLMRSMEILFHGCGRKPSLKIENNQLVNNDDNPHWWEYICWNNQIGNRLLVSHYQNKAATLGQFFLKDIIQKEKSAGRNPVFVRIPALVDLQNKEPRPTFSMQELMEKENIRYRELYEPILSQGVKEYNQYYIPNDGHFTAEGAALLAKTLEGLID